MRVMNKRMYELTGSAGEAQNALYEEAMKDGALGGGVPLGGIYGHTEKAVMLGATIEEIADACKVALIMGGGPGTHYSAKAIDCAEFYLKLKAENEAH